MSGFIVGCALIAGAVWLYYRFDRRGYHGRSSTGARPTGEVFTDPVTGQKMRVYEDPATGAREYRPEA